jgi:dipeptidyl aminopeptidase/acylaminoacyl peptidase
MTDDGRVVRRRRTSRAPTGAPGPTADSVLCRPSPPVRRPAVRPADLDHLAIPGDPQLHPDGERAAYVLSEVDVDDDRYVRTIHVVGPGHPTRRFSHGPHDTSPRWSPDGRWLAFLRKGTEEGAKSQLHVMPADGGEARRRTDLPLGVSDLAWSPDSSQLAIIAAEYLPEVADLDDDERRRRPKRITRLPYRTDAQSWVHDRRDRLYLLDVAGDDDPRILAEDLWAPGSPAWRPDGEAVAVLADPADWPETDPHNQAWEVPVGGGEPTPLADPGMWNAVHYGPDGAVYLTGLPDPFDWPAPTQLFVVGRGATGVIGGASGARLVSLTGHLDRDVSASATVGPRFVDGGLLTTVEGRGTVGVLRVTLEGWDPTTDEPPITEELVAGHRTVTGFSVRADGAAVAFTVSDVATPGELSWWADGRERCLTDLTKGFRRKVDVRPTQRFAFERDGVELDVWAVLPPGFDDAADRSVPVLFNIHGGPTAQYGDAFFDEFQVEAGAGYLVVGTNPRGSSGRGLDWCRAVVGAWGAEDSVDTLDLEAVVDATLARFPAADPDRVGIMGGSYGGYVTARLLARTDRYRSAIVERGLLQWESFCGTSDIGPFFDRMFLGTSLVDGADVHRAASPTTTAHRITTPTLVLHSERDWRCPPEQGEQLFVALKRAGVPTEMVRFPDESHELSRSGTPKHRVERFDVVLDWHGRWLQPADEPAGEPDASS